MDFQFGTMPRMQATTGGIVPEKSVKTHLQKVYGSLLSTVLAATAGAFLTMKFDLVIGPFISMIVSVGLIFWLASIPMSKETELKKVGILTAFGFLSGLALNPFLNLAIAVNPQIIMSALLMTVFIFGGFSLAALFSRPGKFLYLAGILCSGLSFLFFATILNIFFKSVMIWQMELWLGLFLFCGFVLYDTHMIIAKVHMGDKDYVQHSLDLFLDAINIFKHLIILLSNKENNERKKKRDN